MAEGKEPPEARHDGERAAHGEERVAPLRGAGVSVNVARLGRVIVAALLVGLLVLTVVLWVAGARKNAQISELHAHGVPVEMTVVGCLGLLGGSGSNDAGYSCHGTFVLSGHTYDDAVPGNTTAYDPGTKIAGVSVPGDPALFTTAALLPTQHTSASVYAAPIVLTVCLAAAVTGIALLGRRRRRRRQELRRLGEERGV